MPKPRAHSYSINSWPRARVERFLAFIDKRGPDECWRWRGSKGAKGQARYRFRVRGRQISVYGPRVAWALTRGPVRHEREVIHRCLDVACCNPGHLVLGTPAQRCHLLVARGRSIAGLRHPNVKLTSTQVRQLLALKRRWLHLTGRDIARRMGVKSWTWVNAIIRGAGWRALPAARLGSQPKGPR